MLSRHVLTFSTKPLIIKTIVQMARHPNSFQIYGNSMNRSFTIKDPNTFRYELPPLMDFTPHDIGFPFLTPFKIHLHFKPLVDKEFEMKTFLDRAKQTVSTISGHLANDNIEGIKPLVTEEAFKELSRNYSKYSSEQKKKLLVKEEDILFTHAYSIGIDRKSQRAFNIKILVLFDVQLDSKDIDLKTKAYLITKDLSLFKFRENMDKLEPIIDRKYLCIYQFYREYDSEKPKDWIVSKLTHFKYNDIYKRGGLLA